jgi:hypothetical protein
VALFLGGTLFRLSVASQSSISGIVRVSGDGVPFRCWAVSAAEYWITDRYMRQFFPSALFIPALIVLALTLSACKRNSFDYARTQAPEDSPEYTFNPDLNQPGVSKPAEAKK